MNNEIVLGAMIPQEWLDKLSDLSKSTGRSLNDLVREAIAQYIGIDETKYNLLELNKQLTILQEKIAFLESDRGQIQKLGLRLQILEHQLAKIPNQAIYTEKLSRDNNLIDDNVDDEPDEIIFDFLPVKE